MILGLIWAGIGLVYGLRDQKLPQPGAAVRRCGVRRSVM